MTKIRNESLHAKQDRDFEAGRRAATVNAKQKVSQSLGYDFELHEHPHVAKLVQALLKGGVDALQEQDTAIAPEDFFDAYKPSLVSEPHPKLEIETEYGRPYAVYNWELFYHLPIAIATHLSKNGHFAEARQWLHYIFDPTSDSTEAAPARYWRFKELKTTQVELIETVLKNLSTKTDPALFARTIECLDRWRQDPFNPHGIARFRPSEYMLKAVLLYLDNLIAWGDARYRRETREDINEALQLYISAGNLLGVQPERAPKQGSLVAETYASLRSKMDAMNNALVDVEADLPFDLAPLPAAPSSSTALGAATPGQALYFCVPSNPNLLAYWDIVADRLFKIRNSLNLQGVFRQLPLFAPPIDPGLLAAATAAGLDVAAIASGSLQAVPLVRFPVLAQKATELAQEVKGLGAQLLSTLEKHDGERLSLLRAQYERQILELGEVTRYGQLQEAKKAREGLETAITNAFAKYVYFERQLGRAAGEIAAPEIGELDKAGLQDLSFSASEPAMAERIIKIDSTPSGDADGHMLNTQERTDLQKMEGAQLANDAATVQDMIASIVHFVPQFKAYAQPFGVGASLEFGGRDIAEIVRIGGSIARAVAGQLTYESARASKIANYARRDQDWAYQSNLAAGEVAQAYKQLRAAQIREAVAENELKSHRQQLENAKAIETFLTDDTKGKVTNVAFYAWMKNEVRGLYTRAFDLAYEVAKKAERSLQNELGDPTLRYIAPSYDDAGHQALLSGEKLFADIKRMEVGYLDKNARELELTKHVSLRLLDPDALLALRLTGSCEVELPEWLFDMEGAHYFRRIKTVALSIPCVTGPYASISCKLTLLRSRIRTSATLLGGAYEWQGDEDPRFTDLMGSQESIVTSGASNDGGLFETNLRDERYLPFEARGAWSTWALELPKFEQFDHDTISDVIMHVRYTARDGGGLLGEKAASALTKGVKEASMLGSRRLFSLRHDFSVEWARFKGAGASGSTKIALQLTPDHYPYWSRLVAKGKMSVRSMRLIVRGVEAPTDTMTGILLTWSPGAQPDTYEAEVDLEKSTVAAIGAMELDFGTTSLTEAWVILGWGETPTA